MRFRFHQYVISADLEKMFRQILVHDSFHDFQRILWRSNPSEEVKEFRLNTVTYGTACASFLAKRVLKQISEDNKIKYPKASAIIARDFYVDDLLMVRIQLKSFKILKMI